MNAPIPSLTLLMLFVIAVLASLLVGATGAALTRHNGGTWATTIYAGGCVFAGMMTLSLLSLNTLFPH